MSEPSADPWRDPAARPPKPLREPLVAWQSWLFAAVPIAVLIGVWWAVTLGEPEQRIVNYQILPAPGEVLGSMGTLWFDMALSRSIVTSLVRVFLGFAIGGILAVVLSLAMTTWTRARAVLNPFLAVMGYLPLPALVPLTLAWWGIEEKQKVGFLAIASFVYVWPLILKSLDEVSNVYLQTAYTLGASRAQVVRKVLAPIAAADAYQALRLAFGVGWAYVILAEAINAERGVGYLIYLAQRRSHPDQIYMLLIVIVLLAVLVDKGLAWGGKTLFPWRTAR